MRLSIDSHETLWERLTESLLLQSGHFGIMITPSAWCATSQEACYTFEHTRMAAKKRRIGGQFTVNHRGSADQPEKIILCSSPYRLNYRPRVTLWPSGDSPMAFQTASDFPHRRNKDGSFDSICLKCFATVASRMTQDQLKEFDQKHVCANSALSQRGNHVSSSQNENKTRDDR
jgi:hypothetical protein